MYTQRVSSDKECHEQQKDNHRLKIVQSYLQITVQLHINQLGCALDCDSKDQ